MKNKIKTEEKRKVGKTFTFAALRMSTNFLNF